MPVTKVTASLGLPFGVGSVGGEWAPDDSERQASWEMFVELVTRVTVVELHEEEGLLREALDSFYSLFGTTREILRVHGPTTATSASGSAVSFGHLAVAVLNWGIRPLLSKWHPLLEDYELDRPPSVSRLDWERRWERKHEIREDVEEVREFLVAYAGLLGEVCGAKDLLKFAVQAPAHHGRKTAQG